MTAAMRILFASLMALALAVPAAAQVLPPITASDLNKKKISWPRDLTADRTLLIIAFDRAQQAQVDGWVAGLRLKAPGAPPWYEVPLINNPGGIIRSFIDGGMRRGIPNVQDRAHVVTLYGDKKAVMKAMALTSEKTVHALVVDRTGRILARVSGAYSVADALLITRALKP
jgi:hypothetical protein